jgi:hypothetical protein
MTAFSEMPIGSRVDAQQLYLPNRGEYIRFWHKADSLAFDPKRTSAFENCCCAKWRLNPFRSQG